MTISAQPSSSRSWTSLTISKPSRMGCAPTRDRERWPCCSTSPRRGPGSPSKLAIAELGGNPMIMDAAVSQLGRGESISDTARVLGRHVAAIIWRTSGQERLEEMAAYAGVPVINGLTDMYHPCQVLADLQTIRQHKGGLAGLSLAYVGDGANNMAHSYLLGGSVAGMHVRIGAPPGFQPDSEVLRRAADLARQSGGSVHVFGEAKEAAVDADVVATDTWISMGQESGDRTSILQPFRA